LNNLQFKIFDNFIVDPLHIIPQEQKRVYIGNVSRIGKNEIIKAISEYFRKKNLHDIKFSTFIASVALLIGGSTIHYLIGISIDQNVDFQNLIKTIENWSNSHFLLLMKSQIVNSGLYHVGKNTFQITKVKIFFTSTFWWIKYYVLRINLCNFHL